MQRTDPPTGPWQDVAADRMGPMPGGENLLVVVDYYSCFFEVVVMKSTTTPRIIAALMDIFAQFRFPYTLKTDNGAEFVSGEFEGFHHLSGHKGMERGKTEQDTVEVNEDYSRGRKKVE